MAMKIALFTPFSPESGGGAVQIKSLWPALNDLDLTWYYLGSKEADSHSAQWLGSPITTRAFMSDLSNKALSLQRPSDSAISDLIDKMKADVYWVVAHNEGVSLAAELIRARKRVHLSVHDDPSVTFARSRKYRPFQGLMSHVFRKVLHRVATVDVISAGMQSYYIEKYGIQSSILYRYVPALPNVESLTSAAVLRIGHIGHIYHPDSLRYFVDACQKYATSRKLSFKFTTIGRSPYIGEISARNPGVFESCEEMEEDSAIKVLASCNFVYAMYPEGSRFRRFRRTSIPMKLSTYIQAQRPIFAHAPCDSTLASVVAEYGIGQVCQSNSRVIIERSINGILHSTLGRGKYEAVRSDLLGESQVLELRSALGSGA